MAIVLSEQSIAEMAPNDKALLDARGLLKKGALTKLAKSDDGSLVFGLCQGSGSSPYKVSMDLATATDRPTLRCSCPSRQFPCKHQLGLMLAFVREGSRFPVAAPPADLLDKRQRLIEQRSDKTSTEKPEAPPKIDRPQAKKTATAAQLKKTKEQSDTLETLEQFVIDLVASGLGGLTDKSIGALETQTKRLADADMRGAALRTLQRLVALLSEVDEDDDEESRKALRGLSEERQARISALVTQLWVTIRRGKRALEGKREEGTSRTEADAQLESILGKAWRLPELKAAGYWVEGRKLIELCHERVEDEITEFVTTTGHLLDLDDGSIVRETTSLPFQAMRFGKLRYSRSGVLLVKEAALYPGELCNRRIRWDDKQPDIVTERPRTDGDLASVHRHARTLEACMKALREQLKNPLQPLDAVVLLQAARFGTVGDALVVEDATGARLVLRDPRGAPFRTTNNARHAAAAFGAGSLVVRLFFDPGARAVFGQPLALFAGAEHLRLGL
jgi:hypothetical protein